MAGEKLTASTLEEAKKELRSIYKSQSHSFEELTKEEYEAFDTDERDDSDNHLNEEKLGKEADIIDLAYYKYLPEHKTAYRIILKHKDKRNMEDFFIVKTEV